MNHVRFKILFPQECFENAKYCVGVARKIGAPVYALPEDISEVSKRRRRRRRRMRRRRMRRRMRMKMRMRRRILEDFQN